MRDTRRNKRNEDERRAGRERKGNRERDEARVSRAEKNAKRNGLSQKFPAGPILNTGWRYYAPRSRRKIASCLANSSPRDFPVVDRVEIRNENFSGPRNLRSPNRDLIRAIFVFSYAGSKKTRKRTGIANGSSLDESGGENTGKAITLGPRFSPAENADRNAAAFGTTNQRCLDDEVSTPHRQHRNCDAAEAADD